MSESGSVDGFGTYIGLEEAVARIPLPNEQLAAFCERWNIVELALFGSVLRDDFGPDSDIDVLVRFRPGQPTRRDRTPCRRDRTAKGIGRAETAPIRRCRCPARNRPSRPNRTTRARQRSNVRRTPQSARLALGREPLLPRAQCRCRSRQPIRSLPSAQLHDLQALDAAVVDDLHCDAAMFTSLERKRSRAAVRFDALFVDFRLQVAGDLGPAVGSAGHGEAPR